MPFEGKMEMFTEENGLGEWTGHVCDVVASCIVLHNICEMYGDNCLEEWTQWTHHEEPSSMFSSSSHPTPGTLDIREEASINVILL